MLLTSPAFEPLRGKLHLEIYVERMKREYNCECTTGAPRVAIRETLSKHIKFSYTHKKQ